jgi:hypothetical protein
VTIGDLVTALGVPLDAVLRGLYVLARRDPDVAFMTRLVLGCSSSELTDAERRIGYTLPALHRSVLTLSNGGSLPYANSLEYFAAAIDREPAWQVLGPVPGDTLNDEEPTYRPFPAFVLGTPLDGLLVEVGIDPARFPELGLDPSAFIVMGLGYFDADGVYCYHRQDPGPIYAVGQPQYGIYVVARDFEDFICRQMLIPDCEMPTFLVRMQTALRSLE